MPDLRSARDKLVDVLIRTMGTTVELATIRDDLKSTEVGEYVLSVLSFNGALKNDLSSLIGALGEYGDGLSTFRTVLERHLKRKTGWQAVQDSLRIYSSILEKGCVSNFFREAQELDKEQLLKKLNAIANAYPDYQADRLQEALIRAILQRFSGRLYDETFPELSSQGSIQGWDDLLAIVSRKANLLDAPLLDIFENEIKQSRITQPNQSGICSLVVMLRAPLGSCHSCAIYDYRAYFCPDEQTPADLWVPLVTDKRIGNDEKKDRWRDELESLLNACIRDVLRRRTSGCTKLMLEIFLPSQLLNAGIGALLKVPQPLGEAKPLQSQFPFVFRSSQRFQIFQEGKEDLHIENPLDTKWQQISTLKSSPDTPCYWYHDTTLASEGDPDQKEAELTNSFETLQFTSGYVALKRTASLPSCPVLLQKWMDQLVLASPVVALWWPPMAQSSSEQRHDSFHYFCQASSANSCTSGSPLELESFDGKALPDACFSHPESHNSLRLFFSLASTLFHGRRHNRMAQPFREMVLLVDSPDRWPPPVDASFSRRESGEDGGAVTVFSEEACLPPS